MQLFNLLSHVQFLVKDDGSYEPPMSHSDQKIWRGIVPASRRMRRQPPEPFALPLSDALVGFPVYIGSLELLSPDFLRLAQPAAIVNCVSKLPAGCLPYEFCVFEVDDMMCNDGRINVQTNCVNCSLHCRHGLEMEVLQSLVPATQLIDYCPSLIADRTLIHKHYTLNPIHKHHAPEPKPHQPLIWQGEFAAVCRGLGAPP